MSLLNLQTDLKSLKFGVGPSYDRPGLANSGQPFETVPIPGINDTIELNSEDFLLRGGLNGPKDSFTDIKRLTKFFNDRNSPTGLLFIAKQNLLSNIGVRTQASGIGFNEGVYTPLSTLAQAGISLEGGHIPKQGLLPFRGPRTYTETLKTRSNQGYRIIGGEEGDGNRLVELFQSKIEGDQSIIKGNKNSISVQPTEIISYQGGPNSLLGLEKTRIPIALNNQGAPLQTGKGNIQLQNSGFFNIPKTPIVTPSTLGGFDVFKGKSTTISDFRQEIYNIRNQKVSYVTGIAPSYDPAKNKTIDGPEGSRINYVSPGKKGNVIDYTAGKLDPISGKRMGPVDKINALPIYKSGDGGLGSAGLAPKQNDLVKFRIGAIDTEDPSSKNYINFRAFIDSFSDSYNASWNAQKYMGRGEQFYKYDSFTRDINLSFTLAAQSMEEIMVMYRKLNYLASNLAPDYTKQGYLAGPLVQLTLGGWCYELPGFIKSMTLDVPQESPWEIAIPNLEKEAESAGGITFRNPSVKEMPLICRVTGFTFTPIHKFRPAKQTLNDKTGGISPESAVSLKDTNTYGNERYIALSNGYENNYDKQDNFSIGNVDGDDSLNTLPTSVDPNLV